MIGIRLCLHLFSISHYGADLIDLVNLQQDTQKFLFHSLLITLAGTSEGFSRDH
jgi:hypothetical protein